MPFNKKLHDNLISKGFKYTEHIRYDKYELLGRTILYYPSNYFLIIDKNGETASKYIYNQLMELI